MCFSSQNSVSIRCELLNFLASLPQQMSRSTASSKWEGKKRVRNDRVVPIKLQPRVLVTRSGIHYRARADRYVYTTVVVLSLIHI